jgi:transcription elongation factor Elf1
MINGIDTEVIPTTIKDWISGKIVKALPHRLIQKLLGFLIDNRDMTDTIAYKEKNSGEIPEFTIYLYRTAKAKVRAEKNFKFEKNVDESPLSTKNDKPIFDEEKLNGEGLNFFSDEIIVEQSQVIPLNQLIPGADPNAKKIKAEGQKRRRRAKQKNAAISGNISDSQDSESQHSDKSDNSDPTLNKIPKKPISKYKLKNPNYKKPLHKPGEVTKQVLSDEYTEISYLPSEKIFNCNLCGRTDPKAATLKLHVDTVHRRKKQAQCHICGQQFQWNSQLKRHMCIHTGEYPFHCDICNKNFMTKHKYREEHQKKHHEADYWVWKNGEGSVKPLHWRTKRKLEDGKVGVD